MPDSPFLLTPGPVPVPPEVLAVQSEPQQHHRSAAFVATYGEVLRKLKLVFRTEHDVLLFTASGTGAFESVYANLVEPRRSRAVRDGGRVRRPLGGDGARVRRGRDGAGVRVGAPARSRRRGRGDGRRDAAAGRRRALGDLDGDRDGHPGDRRAHAAGARACSRSTPSRASARCRSRPTPGASTSSSRARRRACPRRPGSRSRASRRRPGSAAARPRTPRFYFDWKRTLDAQNGGGSPFTPATSTVNALDVALDLVLDEGLEAIWERTRGAGRALPGARARVRPRALLARRRVVLARDRDRGARGRRRRRAAARGARRRLHHRGRPRPHGRQGAALRAPRARPTRTPSTPASTRCWPRCRDEPAALRRRRADRRGRASRCCARPATSSSSSPAPISRAALADADALVVRSATPVDAALIAAAPKLRVIGRAGVGVDNVDVDAATTAGIVVCNAPEANVVSAAEHALALLLALARHVSAAERSLRDGAWERERFAGIELADKTLALLGFGRIGRLVASRARALGHAHRRLRPVRDRGAHRRAGRRAAPSRSRRRWPWPTSSASTCRSRPRRAA